MLFKFEFESGVNDPLAKVWLGEGSPIYNYNPNHFAQFDGSK